MAKDLRNRVKEAVAELMEHANAVTAGDWLPTTDGMTN